MPPRLDTTDTRRRFRMWTNCLLDPNRAPIDQLTAAHEWYHWGLSLFGIEEIDIPLMCDPFFANTRLATGKAISPAGAARCIREYRRTAVFLQALDAAIQSAFLRFPRETIHVLEAGCGPLAPLALAFAERYPPERVVFTLLDLHPTAIEGAHHVADILGVSASIRAFLTGDASTLRLPPAERPHIIVCEVLLRALTKEPQVAVTRNLAPQLRPQGIFLPERIDIDAGLLGTSAPSGSREDSTPGRPRITEIGRAFSLDAITARLLEPDDSGRLKGNRLRVPAHDSTRTPLRLFTRIQVFEQHCLGDYDSSLNLPEPIAHPNELALHGGEVSFAYETSAQPGLRLDTI